MFHKQMVNFILNWCSGSNLLLTNSLLIIAVDIFLYLSSLFHIKHIGKTKCITKRDRIVTSVVCECAPNQIIFVRGDVFKRAVGKKFYADNLPNLFLFADSKQFDMCHKSNKLVTSLIVDINIVVIGIV